MASANAADFRSLRLPVGVGCWAGLLVLYLALIGRLSAPDLTAGAVASLVSTIAVMVSGSREHLGRMRWGWWWLLLRRVPFRTLADTAWVLAAAVGREAPRGGFRPIDFEPGGDNPASASRRAMVVFGASIAPNSYVVTIETEHKALLAHELVPEEPPRRCGNPEWPI